MAALEQGAQGAKVRKWQETLNRLGFESGPADGEFGPVTAAATEKFQAAQFLPSTGEVDGGTLRRAVKATVRRTVTEWAEGTRGRVFRFGPDRPDLREQRPFFVVPLEPEDASLRLEAAERIQAWTKDETQGEWPGGVAKGAITDVFISSHGWHRNLFGALSAYDQLSARLSLLLRSGRIRVPRDFHPLFINLHWHSDPGENGWVDFAGRREKDDFLRNAAEVFLADALPPGRIFASDFERLYEAMSEMSAPGKDALSGGANRPDLRELTEILHAYRVKDAASVTPAEKTAILWSCYERAAPKRVLLDQATTGRRFLWPWQALAAILQFLISLLGIGAVLSVLRPSLILNIPVGNRTLLQWLYAQSLDVARWPALHWIEDIDRWMRHDRESVVLATTLALLLPLCILTVCVAAVIRRYRCREAPTQGIGFLGFAAWAYWQLWFTVPLVLYVTVMYLLTAAVAVFNLLPVSWTDQWVFNERAGLRGRAPDRRFRPAIPVRVVLEWLARLPVWMVNHARARDSRYAPMIDAANNQLAFYEMQHRGVMRGDEAGLFIANLMARLEADGSLVEGVRLHLLGHSFGSLVVSNASRRLAWTDGFTRRHGVHSLTLVQGAIARNWFDGEERVLCSIRTVVSCLYSRYDTANGFYYPAANKARLAAGFMGLYGAGLKTRSEGGYVSLVRPPDLKGFPPDPPLSQDAQPVVINFDASRLISEGPVALGGGHADIYKDDVLHAIWTLCAIPERERGGHPEPDGRPNETATVVNSR